jgi:polygalacturonase
MSKEYINIEQIAGETGEEENYTSIFQKAFRICKKQGGGTVYVPPGKYLTGPIEMISNTNLHIDAGAELVFSNDLNDFTLIQSRWEGHVQDSYMPFSNGKRDIKWTRGMVVEKT